MKEGGVPEKNLIETTIFIYYSIKLRIIKSECFI